MHGERSNSVNFTKKILFLAQEIVRTPGEILRGDGKKVFVSICINAYHILVELPCYPTNNNVMEFYLIVACTRPLSVGSRLILSFYHFDIDQNTS